MGLFDQPQSVRCYETYVFAARDEHKYRNFFTVAFSTRKSSDAQDNGSGGINWGRKTGKSSLYRFKAHLSLGQVNDLFGHIANEDDCTLQFGDKSADVQFGRMLSRPRVFIPNYPETSLGRDWWPGGFEEGFYLDQLFPTSVTISLSPGAQENACGFVEEETGVRLSRLIDFVGSAIKINDERPGERVLFGFNQDQGLQTFRLYGDIETIRRRVIMEFWEGEESLLRHILDLGSEDVFGRVSVPFWPTTLGYEVFEFRQDEWVLVKARRHHIIRSVNFTMGVLGGVVALHKPDGDVEDHAIVVHEHNYSIGGGAKDQPWWRAERARLAVNKGQELRDLGSIFVPAGDDSSERIRSLICDQILASARQTVQIWDAYLDDAYLGHLTLLALTRPTMNIQLLLSECRGEHLSDEAGEPSADGVDNAKPHPLERIRQMPRSQGIVDFFNQSDDGRQHVRKQGNLAVRNWFRSGDHAFHDRFIIVDDSVWHLGSSLKDMGRYHTTVYRLDDTLGEEVKQEFKQAWQGNFGRIHPIGVEIFPEPKWLEEGVTNDTI